MPAAQKNVLPDGSISIHMKKENAIFTRLSIAQEPLALPAELQSLIMLEAIDKLIDRHCFSVALNFFNSNLVQKIHQVFC